MMSKAKKIGLFLTGVLFMACAGSPDTAEVAVAPSVPSAPAAPAASGALSLDAVIVQAARRMEQRLPGGTKVAIVSVASPSTAFSGYVIDSLEAALVDSGTVKVVDRANLEKIRAEQGFQLSGDVSDESAKAIGQMLGAGAIVTGSLLNLGDEYRLTLKAINIESAEVAVSYPADIANDKRVQALLASGIAPGAGSGAATSRPAAGQTGLAAAAPAPAAAAPAPAPAAPTKVYKVGDTGPAGGIVFYDKEVFSNGWRYLEAMSATREFTAQWGSGNWGSLGKKVAGTGTATGTGKRNTEIIVTAFKSAGEAEDIYAAQLCAGQEDAGGYNDWFLPSKDELNWMYRNLKQKGLGGFGSAIYWSSSQSSGSAWFQNFSNGSQNDDNYYAANTSSYSVRAIRAF